MTRTLDTHVARRTPRSYTSLAGDVMQEPKPSTVPEEFFFGTVRVAQASAAANEKAKFITMYPSKPWRSAVVTAFVSCPDDMARDITVAVNEAVMLVFHQYSQRRCPAGS